MIEKLLEIAFIEDFNDMGDITSDAIFTDNKIDTYWLIAKQDGILCGAEVFTSAFHYIDPKCKVQFYCSDNETLLLNSDSLSLNSDSLSLNRAPLILNGNLLSDGDNIKNGQKIARVEGVINTLLKGERVALNFISHLSGIATQVKKWTNAISNTKTKILDTRKTLPGWRALQKYAVKCGGGTNHRMGLYDMVMIKDNHIDSAGGITKAVEMIRQKWDNRFKIEVETRTLQEVQEALNAKVDIIMLDNMDILTIKEAVKLINGSAKSEASGNMTLERVKEVAEAGVDYISVGALTHSVTAFDFSLRKI